MTQVFIPANTTNSISKIIELQFPQRKSILYLGNMSAASNLQILKQYRIVAILTVAGDIQVKPGQQFTHKIINVEDSPTQQICKYFSQTNDFISKNLLRGNVLVHCKAGISRSATVVIAYLMKHKKYRLKRVLEKVKEARNIVNPNQGFMVQLKEYERKLNKILAEKGSKLK